MTTSGGSARPTDLMNGTSSSKHSTFNEVTDATDKEFVGIRIQRDPDGTYYMDQHRMIESIIKKANMTGSKDMYLPYPTHDQEPPLS